MITELNTTPGRRESDWILNVSESEASAPIVLKAATPDYRYGVKCLQVVSAEDDKWIQIKDGDDVLLGPICLSKDIPLDLHLDTTVYGTSGNALTLQTEMDFQIYACITGKTCYPIPLPPVNPSPADEAMGVSVDATLAWDTVFESVTYKVYIGTTSGNMLMVSEQIEKTYDPTLEPGRTYYWRVDEHQDGNTATGDMWTFST